MGMDFSLDQIPMIGQAFGSAGEEAKKRGMHGVAKSYQAYRPEVAQARMNALNNQMSMFGPVNNMLGQMYGPDAQFSNAQATQSPLSTRMMDIGAPKGSAMLMDNSATNSQLASDYAANVQRRQAAGQAPGQPAQRPVGRQAPGDMPKYNPAQMSK